MIIFRLSDRLPTQHDAKARAVIEFQYILDGSLEEGPFNNSLACDCPSADQNCDFKDELIAIYYNIYSYCRGEAESTYKMTEALQKVSKGITKMKHSCDHWEKLDSSIQKMIPLWDRMVVNPSYV